MPELLIVVPGITGSVLRRPDGRPVWHTTLPALLRGVGRPRDTLDELALPEGIGDAPAPDGGLVAGGLVAGWHGWPGLHTGSGYRGLIRTAAAVNPDAVRVFDHDWRLSNRYSAALLGRRVESWLAEWRERTGDPAAQACFLCHSMGGLIVRYYLEVLGGRELAARVLTLGTPFSGAVKAVRALTGDAFTRVPLGARITALARSFPSVGQLLPAYRCVATETGPVTLAEAAIPGLPSAILADGLAFHAELAEAVTRNGPPPYRTHVLAGKRNDTWQSLAVTGGGVDYRHEQRGTDHGGDGTVAVFAAVPPEWPDTTAAEIYTVRHAALADAAATMAAVHNKLSPIDLGATLHPAVDLGLGIPDIAPAGRDFAVTAHSDRVDLLLHATLVDPATGAAITAATMRPTGAGDYTVTLAAPAGLWRIEVSAVAEVPVTTASDLILCA